MIGSNPSSPLGKSSKKKRYAHRKRACHVLNVGSGVDSASASAFEAHFVDNSFQMTSELFDNCVFNWSHSRSAALTPDVTVNKLDDANFAKSESAVASGLLSEQAKDDESCDGITWDPEATGHPQWERSPVVMERLP
jgi:hypothetical protein